MAGDDLVAPDGIGEGRHGVSPVVDVCRERGVGTPDVVGRRSFEVGQRGPREGPSSSLIWRNRS